MPMSNFNGGFSDGVSIRGLPLNVLHPGKVFWVSNATAQLPNQKTGSNSNPGTFNAPFSTLDYAIGQCTANRGDIICIKPGHTEDVAAAAGITVDVDGIAIVGFGAGSLRPKFSFTAAASDIDITAANVSFYNLEFQAAVADVVSGLDISGVAGVTFDHCYFTESGTNLNWIEVVNFATGASDITFESCKFITGDAANDAHIAMVAASGFYMNNCYLAANVAQTSVVGLVYASGNVTNAVITNCYFRSNIDGALWVDFDGTANSGFVANCYVSSIDGAGATSTGDFTGGHFFECYVSGEADAFGLVGGGGVVYNNA